MSKDIQQIKTLKMKKNYTFCLLWINEEFKKKLSKSEMI